MNPNTAALLAVVGPLGIAITTVLYRVGTLMGQVRQQLEDHDRRLSDLEGRRR